MTAPASASPIPAALPVETDITPPPPGAWRRLSRNPAALGSLIVLVLMALIALFAPVVTHYPFAKQDLLSTIQAPSARHPLGTDDLGRDVLSRLVYGARISLSVAVLVEFVVVTAGLTVGLLAGYFGGLLEAVLMRLTDIMLAFPDILLAILLLGTLGAAGSGPIWSLFLVVIALGVTGWPPLARLVRGQVLSLRKREFVEAARALGATDTRILLRHILPNLLSPILVAVTVDIAGVIVAEATLAFLGIGVQPPYPSWGRMIFDALAYLRTEPRLLILPSAALSVIVLALNFLGDGLRDAFDPRGRR